MLTFNPHPVGALSAPQTLTVTNNGLATVHVASLASNRTAFAETEPRRHARAASQSARRRSSSHWPQPATGNGLDRRQ